MKSIKQNTKYVCKDRWHVYTMYAVQLICTNICCFYLYNVHINECTFDKFD